jgi:hypothetical protein
VQVIFDSSAVLAYAQGAIAPGELLMMIGEEDGLVGLPVTCLAEAYAGAKRGVEEDLLRYLSTAVPVAAVLPLAPTDVAEVGRLSREASLGVAHAAVVCKRLDSYLVTSRAALAHRLGVAYLKIIDL